MGPRHALVVGTAAWLMACSGFTERDECRGDETAPCETRCGPGTMACTDGSWGECLVDVMPECMPGDLETCSLGTDLPPGLRMCSDVCRMGPCIQLCEPGDIYECDGPCGPGRRTCDHDGEWGECVEYINPECWPGEVELCRTETGAGHSRCTDECVFGPCDESLDCLPGERASCGQCASQECGADGTWDECTPFLRIACVPGDSRECPGACGQGNQFCNSQCEWSDCFTAGACIPGQRQICPGSLYCGFAYQVCGPSCTWLDCIETG